jgi:membrane glycosyltransferase
VISVSFSQAIDLKEETEISETAQCEKHTAQRSIFERYTEHEIGRKARTMSDWLDQYP